MIRLPFLLLLVSLVLAIEHSSDDRFNRRKYGRPDSAMSYNLAQRRRQQQPHVEIRENNAGRYFRRRPQTTTVPSIFSMKVESESQHVYPNSSPSENLNAQSQQEVINMTDINTHIQQQNIPPTTNLNNPRPHNVNRRPLYNRRRRPIYAQTSTSMTQQTEEITEQVVTSTTTAPIADATVREEETVVLASSDPKVLDEVSSSESHHPTISQIPEAFIQKMEETPEEVIISTSNAPVVVSTTEKVPEKREFTPSPAYVSNMMSFVKRRRPILAQKIASSVTQQKVVADKKGIDSTTAEPFVAPIVVKAQEKLVLSPPTSYVSDLVSIVHPKSRRLLNRGSHKFSWTDVKKDQFNVQAGDLDSNSSQVTSPSPNTPPPVPTLSPWYDGFGK